MPDTPALLLLNPLPDWALARLGEVALVHDASDRERRDAIVDAVGATIRAVLTIGTIGCTDALMARLPRLEIVSAMGVGYEGIDVAAARRRGLVLSHGKGANQVSVADHALALILAAIRGVAQGFDAVRRGEWRQVNSSLPQVTGRRVGILGLGDIGLAIARRCERGFDMAVAYHNRRPRDDVPYAYHPSPAALAAAVDILVVAAPGGPETRHLVDAAVLDALGPEGFLVNIARGSLVDNAALLGALRERRIAGAGLDVIDGEPAVPSEFLALDNLVMTPHVAGRSPESVAGMVGLAAENFRAHFEGRAVATPI